MFSIIVPGRPCMTEFAKISENQFGFTFPVNPHFSHVVVFMIPGNQLPQGMAAAVYLQLPSEPSFRFLGAIADEKPSAMFKVNLPAVDGVQANSQAAISLGISVEPIPNVQAQMAQLSQEQTTNSTALVKSPPSTKILAQRIIKNAFNFLASFAGGQGGQEVVPLKSFEEWWKKFERRIENDPTFLERDEN